MLVDIFIITALLSAILYGSSTVLKKYLFNFSNLNSKSFTIIEMFIHTLFGILAILLFRINVFTDFKFIVVLSVAGFIYGVSIYLYHYAIEFDEASRASQLASLETIITPLAAILLLGESLSSDQFIGVCLIVIGVLVLTIERDVVKIIYTAKFAVLPIFIALIMWGIEDVMIKYSLDFVGFVFAYFWIRLSSFVIVSLIFVNKKNINSVRNTTINEIKSDYKLGICTLIGLITSLSLILVIYTYSIAPLSLSAPIVGTYPIFVIIFLYISSRFYDIKIEKETPLTKRLVSALLFIIGILIISL